MDARYEKVFADKNKKEWFHMKRIKTACFLLAIHGGIVS